jgi:hypothetical protein
MLSLVSREGEKLNCHMIPEIQTPILQNSKVTVGRLGCGWEETGEEVEWAVVAGADVGCGAK